MKWMQHLFLKLCCLPTKVQGFTPQKTLIFLITASFTTNFNNSYFNSPKSSEGTEVTEYSDSATSYTADCCIRYKILSHGILFYSVQNGSGYHGTSSSMLIRMLLPQHSGCGQGLNTHLDPVPALRMDGAT